MPTLSYMGPDKPRRVTMSRLIAVNQDIVLSVSGLRTMAENTGAPTSTPRACSDAKASVGWSLFHSEGDSTKPKPP